MREIYGILIQVKKRKQSVHSHLSMWSVTEC